MQAQWRMRTKTPNRSRPTHCPFAVSASLGLTYLLARRIVQPVKELDRAAAEVARQNYAIEVEVNSEDEMGRLARTFNTMCASIRQAREDLIGIHEDMKMAHFVAKRNEVEDQCAATTADVDDAASRRSQVGQLRPDVLQNGVLAALVV